jgi:hypothetical protein
MISSLAPFSSGAQWPTIATTALGDGAFAIGAVNVSQFPAGSGPITVVRKWNFSASSGVLGGAVVTETLAARNTSVRWHVSVLGDSATPWSVPILTNLTFGLNASKGLKVWAPWDRGSSVGWSETWIDPLQPSDALPGGWWDGIYRYGNARDGKSDFIVAPFVTILSADPDALDAAISAHAAPTDVPMDTHLLLQGASVGGVCFSRAHHRISNFAPVELDIDLVGHEADWRAALGWNTQAWAEYWEPHNPEVFPSSAGTGSYSYWLGSLDQTPSYNAMAYKTNWDLSGRFFPYMGMFLPPVAPGTEWLNDAEGTQPRANVSFAIIGAWYRKMADAGFTDYSYANVNEYGINVVLPPSPPPLQAQPPPFSRLPVVDADYISGLFSRVALVPGPTGQRQQLTCEDTWQNASDCLAEAFPDAVITKSWNEIAGKVGIGAYESWQGSIVVDPGTEGYHSFMLEQLARHIVYEDAFVGYIVDRSDWMDLTSLSRDDGVTFIPEAIAKTGSGIGASLKVSYQRMINDLRAVLDAGPAAQAALKKTLPAAGKAFGTMQGAGMMMMNLVGNARQDQFKPYDGIFSEGSLVSGAGLLGAMSPAILWTYNRQECCRSANWSDFYFQRHLHMGVMPMLPFPGNDHAIPFDAASAAVYVRYGAMMAAVAPAVWALSPHMVSLAGGINETDVKFNAFIAPLGADAQDVALLVPLMLSSVANETVALNLTRVSRVWPSGGLCESAHPFVRSRARSRNCSLGSPVIRSGDTFVLEALWPGSGDEWVALNSFDSDSFIVNVTLQSGAALVRARHLPPKNRDI